jgi:hypothetical protein
MGDQVRERKVLNRSRVRVSQCEERSGSRVGGVLHRFAFRYLDALWLWPAPLRPSCSIILTVQIV